MKQLRTSLVWIGFAGIAALGGCASDAEELAMGAVEAIEEGDLREAHEKFEQAYEADPTLNEAAIGFALTDLALLPESEQANRIYAELGFEKPLDAQKVLYGPGGALDLMQQGRCDEVEAMLTREFPHPLYNGDGEFRDLLRDAWTIEDVMAEARSLDGRLARIAEALDQGTGDSSATLRFDASKLGLGGEVVLTNADLKMLAYMVHYVRAYIAYADGYDWNMRIKTITGEDQAAADELNAHFLHVDDASRMLASRTLVEKALASSAAGLEAAKVATFDPNGLINWAAIPDGALEDARALVDSVSKTLSGEAVIAGLVPESSLDMSPLFTAPPDLTGGNYCAVTVDDWDPNYSYLNCDYSGAFDDFISSIDPDWDSEVVWAPDAQWDYGSYFDTATAPLEMRVQGLSCNDIGSDVSSPGSPQP